MSHCFRFVAIGIVRLVKASPREATSVGKTSVPRGRCKLLGNHQFYDRFRAGNHGTVMLKAQ